VKPAAPVAPAPATQSPAPQAASSTRTCVVPKLRGHTLGRARTLLKKANCGVGFVGRPRGRRAALRIVRQKPAAGTVKPAGFGVSMRLPRVAHRRHTGRRADAAPGARSSTGGR